VALVGEVEPLESLGLGLLQEGEELSQVYGMVAVIVGGVPPKVPGLLDE